MERKKQRRNKRSACKGEMEKQLEVGPGLWRLGVKFCS